MILRPKIQKLRHLDQLHPVLITNEQTVLDKNAGAVPMKRIDPNGSNMIIQQTIEITGMHKEL